MARHIPSKDKFRTEDQLPEEFQWDNIHTGIYEKMNLDQARSYQKSKGVIYLIGLLLLVTLFIGGYLINKSDQDVISSGIVSNSKEIKGANVNSKVLQKEKLNKEANLGALENQNKKTIRTSLESTKEKEQLEKSSKTNVKVNSSLEHFRKQSNLDQNAKRVSDNSFDDHSKINEINKKRGQEILSQNDEQKLLIMASSNHQSEHNVLKQEVNENLLNSKPNTTASTDYLETLSIQIPESLNNTRDPFLFESTINITTPVKIMKSRKLSLSIATGFATMMSKYSGTALAEAKNKYIKPDLGQSAKIKFLFDLNQYWEVSTGISYHAMYNRFDYYMEKDTLVLMNVHVRNEINTLNGGITAIYEDREIMSTAWHRVKHYNSFKSLSLPVMINYKLNTLNKWSSSIGFGSYVTLRRSTEGKSLKEGSISSESFEVGRFGNEIYHTDLSLGLVSNLNVAYDFTDTFSLGGTLEYMKGLSNISLLQNEVYKPEIFGADLFLRIRF